MTKPKGNVQDSKVADSIPEAEKRDGRLERLPEEISENSLIRRMLIGAESVVQTPRMRTTETNENILRVDGSVLYRQNCCRGATDTVCVC